MLPDRIADLDAMSVARHGLTAPRFRSVEGLPVGPHLATTAGDGDNAWMLSRLEEVVDGLVPLNGLGLHGALPAEEAAEAVKLLTCCGWEDGGGGRHGLGRAMRSTADPDQCQYLCDLGDPLIYARFVELAETQPAMRALRQIILAICQTAGMGSVPGMLDLPPVIGEVSERHFWLRLSSGSPAGADARFNTNGNPSVLPSEASWHLDNPRSPTSHRTSRLLLKLYSSAAGSPCHTLEVRSAALGLLAEVPIAPGDGVLMSDVARGSSVYGTLPYPSVEHRGRCPVGSWQLELLLSCVCTCPEALRHSLRTVAEELRARHAVEGRGPSLADGEPLRVGGPSSFRNHPLLGSKAAAKDRFLANAVQSVVPAAVHALPIAQCSAASLLGAEALPVVTAVPVFPVGEAPTPMHASVAQ